MNEKTVEKIYLSTRGIYDDIAPTFYQTRKKPWPIMEEINSYIDKADDIIDLGCGSGRISEFISRDQNYLGIDNSRGLIKIAKTNYSNKKNIKFQVSDIIEVNLPNSTYDLALLIASIHHIPTKELRQQIIENTFDSLKPDGKIIITSWNLWQKQYRRHLFNYKLKLFKYKIISLNDAFIPWQTKNGPRQRYIHSMTKKELKNMLKKTGFKIDRIFYEYQSKKTSIFRGKNLVAIATKK
jgi:SAM-dependent methyltransferase